MQDSQACQILINFDGSEQLPEGKSCMRKILSELPYSRPKKHICIFVAQTREALHTANGDTSFVPEGIASALQI